MELWQDTGVWARGSKLGQRLGSIWEKLMECKGYFRRLVCTGLFGHGLTVSGDKNVLLFLIQGGHFYHEKFCDLLCVQESESPYLLFLQYLQLKRINIPKRHILMWGDLISFLSFFLMLWKVLHSTSPRRKGEF